MININGAIVNTIQQNDKNNEANAIQQAILKTAGEVSTRPYQFVQKVAGELDKSDIDAVKRQFQVMLDTRQVALDDDLKVIIQER